MGERHPMCLVIVTSFRSSFTWHVGDLATKFASPRDLPCGLRAFSGFCVARRCNSWQFCRPTGKVVVGKIARQGCPPHSFCAFLGMDFKLRRFFSSGMRLARRLPHAGGIWCARRLVSDDYERMKLGDWPKVVGPRWGAECRAGKIGPGKRAIRRNAASRLERRPGWGSLYSSGNVSSSMSASRTARKSGLLIAST